MKPVMLQINKEVDHEAVARPEPPCRSNGRWGEASRHAVGRRHRLTSRDWLLPRKEGPGKYDHGVNDSPYDRPVHTVL
jgi:hypothetical protein